MIVAQLAVGNASLVEMIWTVIGIGGIYYNIYNLRDALAYTKALRKMNGKTLAAVRRMRVIAYGDFRNEVFRTAISSIFIVVGIAAMISPPPSASSRVTATSVAITLGFFGIEMLMVIASALDRQQRRFLLRDE
jgi:hypothetical protein